MSKYKLGERCYLCKTLFTDERPMAHTYHRQGCTIDICHRCVNGKQAQQLRKSLGLGKKNSRQR